MKDKIETAWFSVRIVLMVVGAGTVFGELGAMNWTGRVIALSCGGTCWYAVYAYLSRCVVKS